MTRSAASTTRIDLPLLASASASPNWQGFAPASPMTAPEPAAPQGEYNPSRPEAPLTLPLLADSHVTQQVELMAPAGSLEAAYAAFHFGADAIYLGLKKFSARAEAENFTFAELDEITAYAHALQPRRRVFVAVNTLIRQDELAELAETLFALDEIGVDAVILQDLGVLHALQRYFPTLELHGSTQMAVHNRAGAETLRRLGFARVVLARELTFEEVHDITRSAGIETEVFIHGALCYSYSGLCLFSAQTLGRSGNRGRCAYSCRDAFDITGAPETLRDGQRTRRDPHTGFPFSMKDLALPDHLPSLRSAGVSCFKIEGRKKSPLYVATTTDYYRRLMDGTLPAAQRPEVEADLQTVFSRPWTRLFVQSHQDKEVADRDTVGHRGTPIGKVEAVASKRLRFRTSRPLQVHDGLQVDLPALGKPFGFSVEKIWQLAPRRHETYEAAAGALVEIPLPDDYPSLPLGAPVYCSSSQAVKQRYRFSRPRPGVHRTRRALHLSLHVTPDALILEARVDNRHGKPLVDVQETVNGTFPPARDRATLDNAVHEAFARLGGTAFDLQGIAIDNPDRLFVPVSTLNQLRRRVVDRLAAQLAQQRAADLARLQANFAPPQAEQAHPPPTALRWSIKVDRVGYVETFEPSDWTDVDEVIIDVARDHPRLLADGLEALANSIGRERIRLALPPLTRKWEEKGLLHKLETLRQAGWSKWEASNVSAWSLLGLEPAPTQNVDLATDWSLYVVNRLAARQVLSMGARRFALSPEDGLENWRSLLAEFRDEAVLIVHQDTPLFLAESCAYANLIGGCPGKANCKFESMEMVSVHGERVTALDYHCRTIVLNQGPFCLSTHLDEIRQAGALRVRADFVYRPYTPAEVRQRWRLVRAGRPVPAAHCANWKRGLL